MTRSETVRFKRMALKRRTVLFVTDYDLMERITVDSNVGPLVVSGAWIAGQNRGMIHSLWGVE